MGIFTVTNDSKYGSIKNGLRALLITFILALIPLLTATIIAMQMYFYEHSSEGERISSIPHIARIRATRDMRDTHDMQVAYIPHEISYNSENDDYEENGFTNGLFILMIINTIVGLILIKFGILLCIIVSCLGNKNLAH